MKANKDHALSVRDVEVNEQGKKQDTSQKFGYENGEAQMRGRLKNKNKFGIKLRGYNG